jgi:DNA-binding response OmpR family regulator
MARLSYDSVETLIYDPAAGSRAATRAALYTLGFRRIATALTLDAFVEATQQRPPDLALVDIQGDGAELCAAIQQLRQGFAGHNPFIVIIVTASQKNGSLIDRVVTSGADDLVLRPFSTGQLGSRIATLIHLRKSFVVTSDYVGPDRRGDAARRAEVAFDPPNSLKLKAQDCSSPEAVTKRLEDELAVARAQLHEEKFRRDSFQVCILWRMLQDRRGDADDLEKLAALARSLERRAVESQHNSASEFCGSLRASVDGLMQHPDQNASMRLFGNAALTLHLLLHPDKTTGDQISEIDATVALIRARQQVATKGKMGLLISGP